MPGASRYEVSTLGSVRSNVGPTPHVLSQHFTRDGYARVDLWRDDGAGRWVAYVHRLIALAFIGPPPTPDHVVDHVLDGSRINALSNLRWVLEDDNRWRWKHGTDTVEDLPAAAGESW